MGIVTNAAPPRTKSTLFFCRRICNFWTVSFKMRTFVSGSASFSEIWKTTRGSARSGKDEANKALLYKIWPLWQKIAIRTVFVRVRNPAAGWKLDEANKNERLGHSCLLRPFSIIFHPAKRRVLATQRARKAQYDFGGEWHSDLQRVGNTKRARFLLNVYISTWKVGMASSASFLIASQRTHSTNPQGSTFNEHHAAFSTTKSSAAVNVVWPHSPVQASQNSNLLVRYHFNLFQDLSWKLQMIERQRTKGIIVTQLLLFGCFCR